jgi:hypothetical protein
MPAAISVAARLVVAALEDDNLDGGALRRPSQGALSCGRLAPFLVRGQQGDDGTLVFIVRGQQADDGGHFKKQNSSMFTPYCVIHRAIGAECGRRVS